MKKQLSRIAIALTIIIPTMSVLLVAIPIIVLVLNNSKNTQHLSKLQIASIKNTLEKKNEKTIILDSSKSGSITAHANDIKMELQKLIGSKKIDGVSIIISSPKSQAGNIDHKIVRPIIINLKKEKVVSQVFGFKVKRKKNNDELIQGLKTILENVVKDDENIKKTIVLASDKTGTIEQHKKDIADKIKELVGDTYNSNEFTITITATEEALAKIDHEKAKAITVTLEKGSSTKVVIDGFKVKREKNDEEWVEYIKNKLENMEDAKKTIILVSDKTGKIENHKEHIKAKIKELVDGSNSHGVKIDIKKQTELSSQIDYKDEKTITLTLTKGLKEVVVTGFKVKREKSTRDFDNEKVETLKAILENIIKGEDSIKKTIVLTSNKTGTIETHKEHIKAKIKELVGESNLNGVTITVEDGVGVTDNIQYKDAKAIKIILSKGSATPAKVEGFKVIRKGSDEEWVEYVKNKLENMEDAKKTIVLTSDKTGTIETHKEHIKAKIKELVGESNLNGVTITVEDGVGVTDNIQYKDAKAIKIILSKGSATPAKVEGFKVISKGSDEEWFQSVIALLNLKVGADKTIILAPDKIGKIENHKGDIEVKIKELVGESNLNEVDIVVEAAKELIDTTIDYEKSKSITITLTKGTKEVVVTSFKVKRQKGPFDFIKNISTILYNRKDEDKIIILSSDKIGTIETHKDDIANQIKKIVGTTKLKINDVAITIKSDGDSKKLINDKKLGFKIVLSRSQKSLEIHSYSVKRRKNVDEDLKFIETKLKALKKEDKIIVLSSDSKGTISGQNEIIKKEIQKLIKSYGGNENISIDIKTEELNKNKIIPYRDILIKSKDEITDYKIPITITLGDKIIVEEFSVRRHPTNQFEKDDAELHKIDQTKISKIELILPKGELTNSEYPHTNIQNKIKAELKKSLGNTEIGIKIFFKTNKWVEEITETEPLEVQLWLEKGSIKRILSQKTTIHFIYRKAI